MTAPATARSRFGHYLPPLVLLAVQAGLLLYSARLHSVTIDEAGHIASGVHHFQTGNYAPYRVNPPLPRMLAALPVLAAAPRHLADAVGEQINPFIKVEGGLGVRLAEANADRYPDLVFYARWAGVLWSCLGGCVLFLWCRQLYGYRAGLLALTMWCFGPNILAHAQLATPDLPCTAAALLAMYAFRHYLRNPGWTEAYLAGVALGLALLTKFTLLVLGPVWLLLLLAAARPLPHPTRLRRALARTGHALLATLTALLLINLAYEFSGTGTRLGEIPFVSRLFTADDRPDRDHLAGMAGTGNRLRGTWLGELPSPLPEDYLRGIDVQKRDFEVMHRRRPSYLGGQWREHGWWYYYLYAMGVKVPLGFLALFAGGLLLALLRHPASAGWRDELTVYLPGLAILALVSSQTGFSHHMRYALPAFGFLILGAGKVGYFLRPGRWKWGAIVIALLGWGVGSSLAVYPHSLSYFNEAAGGPRNGHAHLLDSNIDWGQDLTFLKEWLDEHPEARPMHGAPFSWVPPRLWGLELEEVPAGSGFLPPEESGPRPGWYAVSVNALRGMGIPGYAPHALTYFQHFRPVARAGYSIYIYHLQRDEVNRVRAALGLPPVTS